MDIYTQCHPGFPVRFLGNEEEQIMAAKVHLNRFNKWSFFGDRESGWPHRKCPTKEQHGFVLYHGYQFEDEDLRNELWIPYLSKELFEKVLKRFTLGTYTTRRGIEYLANQRYREVLDRIDEIFDDQEFLEALNQRPFDWDIYVKHQQEQPDGWIPEVKYSIVVY